MSQQRHYYTSEEMERLTEVSDRFHEGFSRLIAETVAMLPTDLEDLVLAHLQDMASVYGSSYGDYLPAGRDMGIDEAELKPCPFCGASAYIEQGKSEPCQMHGDRSATFRVVAMHTDPKFSNESNAKRRECHVRPTITRSSREDVIEAWNTRAQQPSQVPSDVVERLIQALQSGFITANSNGYGGKYWIAINYPHLESMQAAHGIMVAALSVMSVQAKYITLGEIPESKYPPNASPELKQLIDGDGMDALQSETERLNLYPWQQPALSEHEAMEVMCRAAYGPEWGFLEASTMREAYRALLAKMEGK